MKIQIREQQKRRLFTSEWASRIYLFRAVRSSKTALKLLSSGNFFALLHNVQQMQMLVTNNTNAGDGGDEKDLFCVGNVVTDAVQGIKG